MQSARLATSQRAYRLESRKPRIIVSKDLAHQYDGLTSRASPHPPSSICFDKRNSHALFALELVAAVSPTSANDSRANIVAYLVLTVSGESEGERGDTREADSPRSIPRPIWVLDRVDERDGTLRGSSASPRQKRTDREEWGTHSTSRGRYSGYFFRKTLRAVTPTSQRQLRRIEHRGRLTGGGTLCVAVLDHAVEEDLGGVE
jgi:hypothetical protein